VVSSLGTDTRVVEVVGCLVVLLVVVSFIVDVDVVEGVLIVVDWVDVDWVVGD